MNNSWVRTPLALIFLMAWIAGSAPAQIYTIFTLAGGGLPNNIQGSSASFAPTGVAVNSGGNVFISSQTLNAVFRLDAKSGLLTLVAGNGTVGFSGDNGPAASAQLNGPSGVAVDSAGSLYIADAKNNRIRKVTSATITTVAGNGAAAFSGDSGAAVSASLSNPTGVAATASGNLYIADSGNNRVRMVAGGAITTVAGGGSATPGNNGPATSASITPTNVAVDTSGNLYISDSYRICKVASGVLTTVAGGGTSTSISGSATNVSLANPAGIAVDAQGNLYIADDQNSVIRKVTAGTISVVAGSSSGFSGDNGPAASASLQGPNGVAVDASGNLYITDSGNYRLRKVASGTINTVAGNGAPGFSGDGGAATSAQLYQPLGVAVDLLGNVYIADKGNLRVREVSGIEISTAAGNGTPDSSIANAPASGTSLNTPTAVAVDSSGALYVADAYGLIRKVAGGSVVDVAGNGTAGFSGDNGKAISAQLNNPYGIALDGLGNLYIADKNNNRVRMVANGVITTVAGNGTQGFSGDGGAATSASLSGPSAVAVDAFGNLYIADQGNQRIRMVANGVITTIAGNGMQGFSGDFGPATSASLNLPTGIAFDSLGNLYIADWGNGRIRVVSNGVIGAIAGSGASGFSGDKGAAAPSAAFDGPWGIAVDGLFNVYVSDVGNNRVRILLPPTVPCPAAAVSPDALSAPIFGGNVSLTITAAPSCEWALQSLPSWVTYSGPGLGMGNAAVTLVVARNPGPPRSAVVSIAGVSIPLTQLGTVVGPSISPNGVVALDSTVLTIQPGSWVSIFGSNLAAGTFSWNGNFPTSLGGVSVNIDGKPAYLSYVSPTQINLQAPDDTTTGVVNVDVTTPNGTVRAAVTLAAYAPELVLFDNRYAAGVIPTPNGGGAYGNGSYDLAGPAGHFGFNTRPVKAGEIVELYGVGFGPTNPPVAAGSAFSGAAPTINAATATIGGVPATVQFSGLSSAGVYQLNVVVPSGVGSGDQLVSASAGGLQTQANVYISVQ